MAETKRIETIERILEEEVRPSLLEHEGGVELVSCDNNIVKVRLLGKCAGCPSAYLTTEELIGATIRRHLPEIEDVVLVQEVSEDLLNFAKGILNHTIDLKR